MQLFIKIPILFVVLFSVFSVSTAYAKENINKEGVPHQLDLFIYQATQVKNYEQWIEKYTPEQEKKSRKEMFKKYLSYEMPAMYRKGQTLFFLNSKDKKMEELKKKCHTDDDS